MLKRGLKKHGSHHHGPHFVLCLVSAFIISLIVVKEFSFLFHLFTPHRPQQLSQVTAFVLVTTELYRSGSFVCWMSGEFKNIDQTWGPCPFLTPWDVLRLIYKEKQLRWEPTAFYEMHLLHCLKRIVFSLKCWPITPPFCAVLWSIKHNRPSHHGVSSVILNLPNNNM